MNDCGPNLASSAGFAGECGRGARPGWELDLALEITAVCTDIERAGLDPEPLNRWIRHADPRCERNRSQVAAAYPILAMVISSRPGIPIHREIETTIDRGDRLIASTASILRVCRSAIRRLRGLRPTQVGLQWIAHPTELLYVINVLPGETLPRTHEHWRLLWTYWCACGVTTDAIYFVRCLDLLCGGDRLTRHLLKGLCTPSFARGELRLLGVLRGNLQHLQGIWGYLYFVVDWCRILLGTTTSDLAGSPRREIAELAMEDLCLRYTAFELVRQSEQYQEVLKVIGGGLANRLANPVLEWPALLRTPLNVGSLTLVSLTNTHELELEGLNLQHCASAYADACERGDSHLVSIRTMDGHRLSTMEIRLIDGGGGRYRARLAQHKGMANTEPGPACREAATFLMNHLKSENMMDHIHRVSAFHAERAGERAQRAMIRENMSDETRCEVMRQVFPDYEQTCLWIANWKANRLGNPAS